MRGKAVRRVREQTYRCPVCGRVMETTDLGNNTMLGWECPEQCAGMAMFKPITSDVVKRSLRRKKW